MRARFEDTMTASNNLILDEWKAQATARRLREQNECVRMLFIPPFASLT